MELDRRGAEPLSRSSPNAKNAPPSRSHPTNRSSCWTETFTDPRLCAAIVDRLTFAGQTIETGTASYRLARARALKGKSSCPRDTVPARRKRE
jgi:hypothetical protein